MNETVTTIVGNVVDNPTRRKLESGVSVTTFRVASTARRFDKATQRWADGESLYLRVNCWRQLAENVDRSLVKGDPVVVTGRLYTRMYEVSEQRRASYELEATAIGFDLSRGTAQFQRVSHAQARTTDDVGADGMPGVLPEDFPTDRELTGTGAEEADPTGDHAQEEEEEGTLVRPSPALAATI